MLLKLCSMNWETGKLVKFLEIYKNLVQTSPDLPIISCRGGSTPEGRVRAKNTN